MKITIEQVTVNDKKVLSKLKTYLDNIQDYNNFDPFAYVQVFVNKDRDFTAFESIPYRLQFTSTAHKLIETIKSPYVIDPIPFMDFNRHIKSLL